MSFASPPFSLDANVGQFTQRHIALGTFVVVWIFSILTYMFSASTVAKKQKNNEQVSLFWKGLTVSSLLVIFLPILLVIISHSPYLMCLVK